MHRLRQMSVFAHIVEAGSLTAAAEQLNVSKSVISQHLKALETELGVALLKRTTRRQSLTSAGHAFYQECTKLNQLAESAWQHALDSQQQPQGEITITASDAMMASLVTPAIASLMQQYPAIRPILISDDQPLNVMANHIDLAIRVGPSTEDALKQRRIGAFRDVLCGTAALLAGTQPEKHGYIANQWQPQHIEHTLTCPDHTEQHFIPSVICRADSFHTCMSLIDASVGVGLVPDYIFAQKQPLLSPVFPEHQLPLNPIYALHPFTQHTPLSVQVCIEAIERQLQHIQALSHPDNRSV
ncbi:LysR substrate-binding domain-containing protein [Photobacterium japonica]|uniref:LysR family transcriptional regulator n=1 Tax=Photobacterium japonica TaxID=2910235 RepID=UPI003D131F91